MGKLYVCITNRFVGLLTFNKDYEGYPSPTRKGFIHIISCDDGKWGEFPDKFFDLVEDYD